MNLERFTAVFGNPWLTLVLGGLIGFALCWSSMVRPLKVHLDEREAALHEWERINRTEREAVANIKTISTESMRKWITAVDEQNVRFAEIQSLLHKQEIALTGPATTEMVIALLAVLLVFGFVAWMIRDSNAEAARTLQSAIAVLPTLKDVIRNREITAKEASVKSSILTEESHRRVVASVERSTGTILEYLDDPSYGYIAPADGGDKVSFNKNELSDTMSSLLRPGLQVSYIDGKDSQGRDCAKDVQVSE